MSNILNNFKKDFCCGCTACENVCPTQAITMRSDEKGFLYPLIEENKCINCGLCVKVCDFKKFTPTKNDPDCYAVKHKNEDEVRTSRSGAVFMALCDYILNQNGIIFGCAQIDKNTIVHKFTTVKDGVNAFKGSKYVQSDLLKTFKECKDFLKEGKNVLFSGTGCQVHGLLSYLEFSKVETSKLITCDIVCHGTPSSQLWRDYVKEYERRHKDKIICVNFRDKERFGWKSHFESFLMESGTTKITANWTNVFYSHVMFREACYNCKYTTPNRKTDFTIADYWGIENNVPEFDDNKGVSLVLVRGEKGKRIFTEIEDELKIVKTKLETSLQPQLIHPIEKGKQYDRFWKNYLDNKNKAIKKYFFPSKIKIFFKKVKNKINKVIKHVVN